MTSDSGTPLGRGWTHGERFRPAREVEIIYGHNLVKSASSDWPSYLAVSGNTAWNLVEKYVSKAPEGVGIVTQLDWAHLEEVTSRLPDNADMVIGIGGGTALDAAKYVALRKDLPLRLVPSAISTGAIIHGIFAKWEGRKIAGKPPEEWPYCDFEHVLVDYDFVLEAPKYLNTAGLGDILCMYSGIAEWEHASSKGKAPQPDNNTISPIISYYESVVSDFVASLDRARSLTVDSVRLMMTAMKERDDRTLQSEHAPGTGHSMTGPIEEATQRGLIHGEMAALGAVIVTFLTGHQDMLISWLDKCDVRFRPDQIGLSRDELKTSLDLAAKNFGVSDPGSILAGNFFSEKQFTDLWSCLSK